MAERPKPNLTLSTTDRLTEAGCWILLLIIWAYTLYYFDALPDTIPIHYNAAGEVDGTGNKWNILALPIVGSVLTFGIFVMGKYPHYFNYPIEINEENAAFQYLLSTRLLRWIRIIILILFGSIVYETVQISLGQPDIFGVWFLPMTFILFTLPLIVYLIYASKKV